MPDRFRRAAAGALVAYVGLLAFVLGQTDASLAISVVGRFAHVLDLAGAPGALTTGSRAEFVLNAAMFAPLPLLAALTFPRHPWANWVVYGFVGSVAVEVVQALWLPLRSAQYVDIVANTAGSLIGAVGAVMIQRAWTARTHWGGKVHV
ncbi:VanZ family protein [Nocardioides sediminis]|uniref:VanZ family protein n=1 Tax=Nocardioides sediminis TaxID=433648 RepID=UPI00131EE04F|nr:VanZ family protein [Nocardioides sediminis]